MKETAQCFILPESSTKVGWPLSTGIQQIVLCHLYSSVQSSLALFSGIWLKQSSSQNRISALDCGKWYNQELIWRYSQYNILVTSIEVYYWDYYKTTCDGLYSFEIRTINNFIANIIYFISHIHIPLVFLFLLFQTWWTRCITKMVNNSWSISPESSSNVYFHFLLRNNINLGCEKRSISHWFQ